MFIARRVFVTFAALFAFTAPALAQDFTPTRFAVEIVGQGPDVILIPGLGSSRDVWAAEVERLSATHRLHLVQIAGFAGEPAGANAEGELLAPIVGELDRYIDAAGLQSPAVVGHSMGGLLGLMLADAHPEDVGRLVIVDALPFFTVLFDPNATAQGAAPFAAQLRNRIAGLDEATFRAEQEPGVARLVRTPERRAEVVGWTLASDRGVFARAMYEVMTTDMRARVGSIQAPVLVLYAYDPVMGPQAMVDGLYSRAYADAPNGTVARIDNSFHFILLDQPEAFHTALAAFLR